MAKDNYKYLLQNLNDLQSGPKSRRPIHDNIFPDEIRDNIKNDKLDKSKRMNNREVVTTDSGEDHITTDDENCENSAQIPQRPTETSKKVNEKPLRRSARKSSSSERVSSQLSSPQYGWEESLRSRQKSSSENRKKKENLQKKADSGNNVTKSSTETGLDKKIITGIFVGIVLLAAVAKLSGINGNIFSNTNDLQTNSKEAVLRNVKKALQTLGSKYKNQNSELWQNAYFGITNLIKEKNKKPSIILLLGKNSDPVDCLAALLGNVSSNALSSGTLQLTPDKFANNVGMVVESLRKQIKEKINLISLELKFKYFK